VYQRQMYAVVGIAMAYGT
jgi:choline/carnitine/betaine transport